MKSRLNLIMLVSAAVLAAAMIVSGFLLFQGIRKYNLAEKRASKLFRTLADYYEKKPFPSPANVEVATANARRSNEWTDRLLTELKKGESTEVEKSPLLFMRRLGETRNTLLATAQKQGVTVSPQFTFGFEQYLGEQPRLPPPLLVPQLTHQLVAINTITHVLLASGASSIDAIIRTDLESPGVPTRPTGRPRPNVRPVRPLSAQKEPAVVSEEEETSEKLFSSEPLGVEFHGREAVAVRVLNALASMPLPVTVTRIELRRDLPDVVLPPPQLLETEGEASVQQTELYHEKRVVSGHSIEAPLWIKLELNIHRFSEGESGESD